MENFTLEALENKHDKPKSPVPALRPTFTEEEMFVARVGVAIRVIRLQKRFTQQKLAAESGVPLSTLSKIEQGQSTAHIITIRTIERGLGVKPGWLQRLAS